MSIVDLAIQDPGANAFIGTAKVFSRIAREKTLQTNQLGLRSRRRCSRCRRFRLRLATGRRHCIDRRVRLRFARSSWRRIYNSRIAFLFLGGRISHSRLLLLASRQQC